MSHVHKNLNYFTRPTLDEFELQELGESLQEAMRSKRPITLTVYKIGEVTGVIEKMDAVTRKIHLQTESQGLFRLPFLEIWGADDPGE
ncbi:YolD-like family protein [Paenibacillus zanthoxyli]|uniref:YolD-like family protein n=1 Tax=Paenibacillus zanthoxyli TaxID=369399 RepID=UPI00046E6CA1|nr:YolD-like family protein [Paenibacillus zanthoxyli]